MWLKILSLSTWQMIVVKECISAKLKSTAAPEKHGPKESGECNYQSFCVHLWEDFRQCSRVVFSQIKDLKEMMGVLTDPSEARGILESSRVLTVSQFSRSQERKAFISEQS